MKDNVIATVTKKTMTKRMQIAGRMFYVHPESQAGWRCNSSRDKKDDGENNTDDWKDNIVDQCWPDGQVDASKWPLAAYLLQFPRHQRLWQRSRCLPSWPSSKTTRRRSHRSGDEEGDDEDDADGRKDDVGDVEADSHHSLLSPRCQGLLGLANIVIVMNIRTIIIKMTELLSSQAW